MASPYRRTFMVSAYPRSPNAGTRFSDPGPQDVTRPTYLTQPTVGPRTARVITGRGTFEPGYVIRGTQPGALDEGLTTNLPRVLKMVSPLTGQGPADPRDTGYFSNMNLNVRTVNIVRVQAAVPPNIGWRTIAPPRSVIRRMDTRGSGTVSYI